jgi:toxin-antitoxin system PIN domain toxin
MTPDVNVLLAASRSDHPQHRRAVTWLERALAGCTHGDTVEILPMVAVGFLRIATHRRVFAVPTPMPAAVAFLDSILAVPGAAVLEIGRELKSLQAICVERELSANDVTDAWIAAVVLSRDLHLVTFDRGFSRLLGRSRVTILDTSH